MEVQIADTHLVLRADRSAWWPEADTLLITDTHFGKAAAFRRAGLPVPAGTTKAMLERLTNSIVATKVRRLVVLGDLIHCGDRSEKDFTQELVDWRKENRDLDWILVRGNHDRGHRKLFDELGVDMVDAPYRLGPFELCHYPDQPATRSGAYRLAGHLHPCVMFRDPTGTRTKLPCFWFSSNLGILPAFGSFTGSASIEYSSHDVVVAIAENQLIRFHTAGTSCRGQKEAR